MIQYVPETGSTNSDLIARLSAGDYLPQGTWLVADRQVQGRGRHGRTWLDGPGNYMGSTVVHLRHGDPAPGTLALMSGLAVYETVSGDFTMPAKVTLKWPNDLLIGSAKFVGILLERVRDTVVVGIGANLAAAPALPDRDATSLAAVGRAPDRNRFAEALAARFDIELARWREYGLAPIVSRWQAAAHPLGTPLSVSDLGGGNALSGSFAGLSPDGSLQLRLADGTTRAIHAGEVRLVEP